MPDHNSSAQSPLPSGLGWQFDNSYHRLPEIFYRPQQPTPVKDPALVVLNHRLAAEMGLDFSALSPEQAAALLAGNVTPPGSQPLAQAYAGHQFGSFNMLGDGRAILLGEHLTPSRQRLDIQLKGAGPTPYSRRGDGRAALGPMLREYLISEAMHALGIPTTRSLAVVATGEAIYRETALPGAVLTRVAASHLRVGTFEFAASADNGAGLAALVNYALARHDLRALDDEDPVFAFLQAVMNRQADLIVHWMRVGFIHGVMNTDNMSIAGETIDYGPCAFMNAYSPATVYSSIDRMGRYAFGQQPRIAQWNLARLAESLWPLQSSQGTAAFDRLQQAVVDFKDVFQGRWLAMMAAKLGIFQPHAKDEALIQELLLWMEDTQADYTNTFRSLRPAGQAPAAASHDPRFLAWLQRWQARLAAQSQPPAEVLARMDAHNPAYIPRNHQVEAALAAADEGDLKPFGRLLAVLENPYHSQDGQESYTAPPDSENGYRTFCGT